MSPTGATAEHALAYAVRGWQVFAIKAQSKEPATRRGFYEATSNPATIRRWFGCGYPYNIAVRTGEPSGVFVLDVDGEIGTASQHKLTREYGPLPHTLVSITGKGRHLWFRTDGQPVPCNISKIAPGIDIRGDGGYVVAPPSIHPSGTIYRWANDLPPVTAPEWLVKLAQRPKPQADILPMPRPTLRVEHDGHGSYGRAALDREIEALAIAARGGRNAALNSASFRLHQLVAGGELDGAEVERRLIEAATANGLTTDPEDGPRSVLATIRSGAKAGLSFPRGRQRR